MYLHLGKNVVVQKSDVIAVFDLDNSSYSHIKRGEVINVAEDLPKSFVVCKREDGGQVLYLSQLASTTLLKRAESVSSFE